MADITDKYKGLHNERWEVRIWDGDEWPDKRVSIGEAITNGKAIAINPRYISQEEFMPYAKLISDAPMLLSQLNEAVELLHRVKDKYAEHIHMHSDSDLEDINYFLNSIGGK